jgi:hypothetical protein
VHVNSLSRESKDVGASCGLYHIPDYCASVIKNNAKEKHLNTSGKLLVEVVSVRRQDSTAAYSTTDY